MFGEDPLFAEVRDRELSGTFPLTQNELSNSDILMSFIYFNVSSLRLAAKPIQAEKDLLNPNLAKLFLRHYATFANQNNINIDSEEEDYVIPVTRHRNSEEITLDNLTPNIRPPPMKPPPMRHKKATQQGEEPKHQNGLSGLPGKKTDIFVGVDNPKALKESDLKNKFEFPSLGLAPPPQPKATPASSWGRGDLYLYEKPGALSKKEQEELFPTLGAEPAKAEKPKIQPVVKPQPKPDFGKDEATPPGAFNWLEESKRQSMINALNHGNIDIVKAKKKKKK